jgi:hypothetical protein
MRSRCAGGSLVIGQLSSGLPPRTELTRQISGLCRPGPIDRSRRPCVRLSRLSDPAAGKVLMPRANERRGERRFSEEDAGSSAFLRNERTQSLSQSVEGSPLKRRERDTNHKQRRARAAPRRQLSSACPRPLFVALVTLCSKLVCTRQDKLCLILGTEAN